MKSLATEKGKDAALAALEKRRKTAPEKIDNGSLPAGSPMRFYCVACGHISDVLPESYRTPPKRLCDECQALKDMEWLE